MTQEFLVLLRKQNFQLFWNERKYIRKFSNLYYSTFKDKFLMDLSKKLKIHRKSSPYAILEYQKYSTVMRVK